MIPVPCATGSRGRRCQGGLLVRMRLTADTLFPDLARTCYGVADAMLAERNKENDDG